MSQLDLWREVACWRRLWSCSPAQRLREADEDRVRHLLHRQGAGHHRPALLLRRGLHPARWQDPGSREAGCGQDDRWVPEEYCIVLYIVLSKFDNEQSDLVHRWGERWTTSQTRLFSKSKILCHHMLINDREPHKFPHLCNFQMR